ncbi:MAG: gliding motility-associated C-terminal domain-containing protein [Sphingobacteriales bacterium]|nr:MAG: gliding motility-associated C-terminal domain-containing protein [Sphingobacteriales bacterium]
MKFSRSFTKILLIVLFTFGVGTGVKASHYAAVDLYLDYIGAGPNQLKYQVTLVVFKACEPGSINLNTNETVCWASSCTGGRSNAFSRSLPTVQGPDTLDQLCDTFSAFNACRQTNSIYPAFIRRIYSDTISVPIACSDWVFYWSNNARNTGINNLVGPGGLSIYIEAGMNNAAKWNNSSPRFIIDPIPYLCQNQPAFFLNGPLDPNNDSMVTINSNPYDVTTLSCAGSGLAITNYTAGYSLANPISSSTGYSVSANTGTAAFTPTTQGKFVVAFRCSEYDRVTGTELGYIMRDVQLSVLNCNAPPPDIDSIPQNLQNATYVTSTSGNYLIACPGVPFSFSVDGQSNSFTNSLFMTSNNLTVAPGSVFGVVGQGTANPTGTFSWTPTGADVGDYTIIITVKDSTCTNNQPILLANYFVLYIKVLPGVDAGPDGRICKLDGSPWQFNVTGPTNVPYYWTSLSGGAPVGLSNDAIQNPTAYPPYNFTYVVGTNAISSNCKSRDTVSVYIDTSNSIDAIPGDAVLCRPGYLQLSALGIGNPPLINMPCGTQNTLPPCAVEEVVEVRSQYTGGTLQSTNVQTAFPGYRTSRIQFLLTQNDLYAYGVRSGTLKGLAFDVNTPTSTTYNNFTISLKCTDRKSLSATTGSFEQGTSLVYTAPGPVAVSLGWNQFTFDTPYNWDSTKSLIVEICYSNASVGTAAWVNAVNTNSTQMAISWANQGAQNICSNPAISLGTVYYAARPNIRFNYCKAPFDDFDYTWKPGTFLSDSTAANPLAYIAQDTRFYVHTIGGNGCKVMDSVLVKIPVHTYDVWPKDTSFCSGESFKMIASGDFAKVEWFEDNTLSVANPVFMTPSTLTCTNCADPIGTPMVSTNYYAVMTDQYGCSDTMVVKAVVKQMPVVNIINRDTTIKYGQSIQLLVSGAYLYSWQPMSSLTNPNIVNPVASPTEPTKYIVYGVAENGCRSMDSVMVNIDYRDNLFVPSAFTPNGDGTNDVFRVTNVTFQRLMEFRVFNRWGQEIYSTNDPRKGWDGTWKGVPQDMGAYQYLIRVAYPDGYVETYKGNVTLVR